MPHQCTDCGRTFDDGSQEMLSGCPDCGGNKFQYKPSGATETESPTEEPPEPPEPPVDSSVARTVGNAATAVRDLVGSNPSPPGSADEPSPAEEASATADTASASTETATPSPEPDPSAEAPDPASSEDTAQASARSDVVSKDELPPAPEAPATTDRPTPVIDDDSDGTTAAAEAGASDDHDRPDLSELRDELNDQFESIKVLDPGKYELNLMELYDREEYIIALQEDGKYTIQVPERWED
ncbi:OapC/ArvC family zinc-ribbon domain-containing protein [Salinibaculum rarum]|uniref:OapC/ArvC family zinc-ribbon domain-containing protein n=1 Tax=Salinibaculum rarum TaxID=3058903 RepID=UPI00265ED6D4|nr:Zn-ribbon containing protein [Salinibaculum sp. KK48]